METPKPTEQGENNSAYQRKYGPISLGYTLAAGMIFFTVLGFYLDHRLDSGGIWTLFGVLLGFVYGGYEVWKVVRNIDQNSSDNSP